MKKHFKSEGPSANLPAGPDVAGMISSMQQQLFSLERKIDALVGQSSRPLQSFDRPPRRYSEGRHGGDFRERKLFKVICADCNKECEVPFRPSAGRPVYCKDCFASRKGGDSSFKEEKRDNRPVEKNFIREHRKEKPFPHKRKKRSK